MRSGILEAGAWNAMMAAASSGGGGGNATTSSTQQLQCPREAVDAELVKLLSEATRALARAKQILGWENAPRTDFAVRQILANQPLVATVHADAGTEWIVQNSWSPSWGEGGYMRLPRGNTLLGRNPCGLLNFATYPVLDKVSPARRGDLIQEGYCSGMDLVASSGGAGRTARQLAEYYGVPLNDFLHTNTHIPADPDLLLDVNLAYYVPPCTRNVPKPPLPTLDCGTSYHIDYNPDTGAASSAYDQDGVEGRRLREVHAAQAAAARRRLLREGGGAQRRSGPAADLTTEERQPQQQQLQQQQWNARTFRRRLATANATSPSPPPSPTPAGGLSSPPSPQPTAAAASPPSLSPPIPPPPPPPGAAQSLPPSPAPTQLPSLILNELYATQVSGYYCGYDSGVDYVTASDQPLAARAPLAAITGRGGFVLEMIRSSFEEAADGAGAGSVAAGPLHGGFAGGAATSVVPLAAAAGVVVTHLRTCCAGAASWGNGAQMIQMRTAAGATLLIGSGNVCGSLQDWVAVPEGYRFAGVQTQTEAGFGGGSDYVHRLAFVFAAPDPPPPPSPAPSAPPPPDDGGFALALRASVVASAQAEGGYDMGSALCVALSYVDGGDVYSGLDMHLAPCDSNNEMQVLGIRVLAGGAASYITDGMYRIAAQALALQVQWDMLTPDDLDYLQYLGNVDDPFSYVGLKTFCMTSSGAHTMGRQVSFAFCDADNNDDIFTASPPDVPSPPSPAPSPPSPSPAPPPPPAPAPAPPYPPSPAPAPPSPPVDGVRIWHALIDLSGSVMLTATDVAAGAPVIFSGGQSEDGSAATERQLWSLIQGSPPPYIVDGPRFALALRASVVPAAQAEGGYDMGSALCVALSYVDAYNLDIGLDIELAPCDSTNKWQLLGVRAFTGVTRYDYVVDGGDTPERNINNFELLRSVDTLTDGDAAESVQRIRIDPEAAALAAGAEVINGYAAPTVAATCPAGSFVVGFNGTAFAGLPMLPQCLWDALATRSGFDRKGVLNRLAWTAATRSSVITARALLCSDGSAVPLDMEAEEGGLLQMHLASITADGDGRYVAWSEALCPEGYDLARVRQADASSEASYGFASPDLFFRCRGTGEWTSYTGGIGVAGREGVDAAPPDGYDMFAPVDPAFAAAVNESCGSLDVRALSGVKPTPDQRASLGLGRMLAAGGGGFPSRRSRDHLQLFARGAQLERMPGGAECPPGKVLAGCVVTRWPMPTWGSREAPAGLSPVAAFQSSEHLPFSSFRSTVQLRAAVCRDASAAGAVNAVPTMLAAQLAHPDPPPAPNGGSYLGSMFPPESEAEATTSPPEGSVQILREVRCPDNTYVTSVFSAGDRNSVSLLGLRCSDGSSSSVGRFAQSSVSAEGSSGYSMERQCPDGFNALQVRGEELAQQSAFGLSTFLLRCDSTDGLYGGGGVLAGTAAGGGAWAQVGYPFVVRGVGPGSGAGRSFTGSEAAFMRGSEVACGQDANGSPQFVSSMMVEAYELPDTAGGGGRSGRAPTVLRAVHVYCAAKPPPSADASFYDIALRYGITLRDLMAANPAVNTSRGLSDYHGTTLEVPQRCSTTAVQPPVTTIAAVCTRRWPPANATVTGAETCGVLAISYRLSLRYLNEINPGLCPSANTRVARGMRLCITPPSAVASVTSAAFAAGRRHRRLHTLAGGWDSDAAAAAAGAAGAPAETLSHRRRLLQGVEGSSGSCISWRWAAEGMSCDSIAAAQGLSASRLLALPDNEGLRCDHLAVGTRLCVQDDRGNGSPSPYVIEDNDGMRVAGDGDNGAVQDNGELASTAALALAPSPTPICSSNTTASTAAVVPAPTCCAAFTATIAPAPTCCAASTAAIAPAPIPTRLATNTVPTAARRTCPTHTLAPALTACFANAGFTLAFVIALSRAFSFTFGPILKLICALNRTSTCARTTSKSRAGQVSSQAGRHAAADHGTITTRPSTPAAPPATTALTSSTPPQAPAPATAITLAASAAAAASAVTQAPPATQRQRQQAAEAQAPTKLSERRLPLARPPPRGGGSKPPAPLASIAIPIRPPALPPVPSVRLGPGAAADIVMEPAELRLSLDAAALGAVACNATASNGTTDCASGGLALAFTTPRYLVPGGGCPDSLEPPAIILDAVCFTFGLRVHNDLPFQPVITCPAVPGVNAPQFVNGPHDLDWTNIHTHGLKARGHTGLMLAGVDPGAVSLNNICEPGQPTAGFPNGAVPSLSDYYCNGNVSSNQICELFGDNVLANGRPLAGAAPAGGALPHDYAYPGVAPGGAVLSYTYPLGPVVPGVGWYHPHQHGSVGIQTPTAAAPLIVPQSWLPGGLSALYLPARNSTKAECSRLTDILGAQPLETSTRLQFNGLWFRKTPDGGLDDDTLPFLGLAPGGQFVSPLLYNVLPNGTAVPRYTNTAGRDWGLVNGAFQPTISITEKTYARWQLLNTMTMKWLDLTIQQVDEKDGSLQLADCDFFLLARDGVPLPVIPRKLRSNPAPANGTGSRTPPPAGGRRPRSPPPPGERRGYETHHGRSPHGRRGAVSDLILGPANRADVLVKCNKPGTYVLASGAGPFHTNYNACKATHCECFGDPPANGATALPANNLYGGRELSAAVLAVIEVKRRFRGVPAQPDFKDGVCRSRLERFPYLDYAAFPQPPVEQCFSFMNQMGGGFCSINSQLFPTGTAHVQQGTQQVGDWQDSILFPVCQTGCPWPDAGSGGGLCGSPVNVCDEVEVQWLASMFNMPSMPGRPDLCDEKAPDRPALTPPKC
ncbi:hypothetical protein HXX76_009400 [Chlamydomonas incerta]|uniref:LysM domain-containing protein n=1 Tax=Chlamydomonas incerta TaxID=51695 RepID=A0A835VZZ3_CHLIN|nr:hypothetical protein HXX76_009400 [Chlamydomonas incerta]|eukprot:KAG2431909.1 hypothetical protein HXX76_009400 [Chlamydomonas incerta]